MHQGMQNSMCCFLARSHIACTVRVSRNGRVQVGDLLLQIGDVSSSNVPAQETMGQVASLVRVCCCPPTCSPLVELAALRGTLVSSIFSDKLGRGIMQALSCR